MQERKGESHKLNYLEGGLTNYNSPNGIDSVTNYKCGYYALPNADGHYVNFICSSKQEKGIRCVSDW